MSDELLGNIAEHMTNLWPSPTATQMRLVAEVEIRQGDLEKALSEALRASEEARERVVGESLHAVVMRAALALHGMDAVGTAVYGLVDASKRLIQEMAADHAR